MTITEQLKSNYGYVTDGMVKPMIEEFGADFKVIAKTGYGQRYSVSLVNLKRFELALPGDDYIKAVFVDSETMSALFK